MTRSTFRRAARNGLLRKTLAVALLATCGAAQAVLVGAGQSFIFNFDMNGLNPLPPYDSLSITPNTGSIDAADQATFTVFGSADAQGAALLVFGASETPFISALGGVLDGVFSLVFTVTQGQVDLDSTNVIGFKALGGGEFAETAPLSVKPTFIDDVDPPVVAVPEPASFALAGVALVAGASARRRKSSARHDS